MAEAAALALSLGVGDAVAFDSIEAMVLDASIDCLWICGPNHARVDNMGRIAAALARGARLVGVACESRSAATLPKPRARWSS